MKNTLVTVFGGSGFVGRHTVRALARQGYRIRVGTRHPNLAIHLLPMGHVGQIQLFKMDAHDPDQIHVALQGASYAVNLLGVLYSRGEQSFEALHVHAAEQIARGARESTVRHLVHVSALGADAESDSSYAHSKAEGEARVRDAFPEATVLRPSIVFGPEDSFFNRFAAMARLSPFLPLIGGGKTRFQPVFVGDVADAIVSALTNSAARGARFELGGPNIYTFRQLMEIVLRETDRTRLLLPVPFGLATLMAAFLQFLPSPLLTPDQVTLLKTDNVVSEGAKTLGDLGIDPTSVEAEVPSYLWRFRPKGQYESEVRAHATSA